MENNSAIDRIPPFNLEAERSVLGSCLLDSEALTAVMEGLSSEDFYDPRHRKAFEVMESMASRNVAVDSLTFRDEIKKQSLEERLGGISLSPL